MDIVTLSPSGKTFRTKFAAPSVLTGYFVAAVIDADREEIEEAFTDPGDITVHNEEGLYADKTYTGYTGINEIREDSEKTIVILDKEERHGISGGNAEDQ